MNSLRFENRKEAGEMLAEALGDMDFTNPVLLAVPRGGVEVAYPVSKTLDIPIDVIIPKKLGAPGNPEMAIGAVTGDGSVYIDEHTVNLLHVSREYIQEEIINQLREIKKREKLYREESPKIDIKGRSAILIDDGVATGATMISAIRALRSARPAEIIVAIPVAPTSVLYDLKNAADDVVCLYHTEMFFGVGQFYCNFQQVTHERVIEILKGKKFQ